MVGYELPDEAMIAGRDWDMVAVFASVLKRCVADIMSPVLQGKTGSWAVVSI